jgi:hypothetical protein
MGQGLAERGCEMSDLTKALADIADDLDGEGSHWKANRVREAVATLTPPAEEDGLVDAASLAQTAILLARGKFENGGRIADVMDRALAALAAARLSRPEPGEVGRAYAAMRWVYRNGMVPDPTRPDWVSEAFSDAFASERAAAPTVDAEASKQ